MTPNDEPSKRYQPVNFPVVFDTYEDFEEFQSMAEGMWEVARDDEDEATIKELHDLICCVEKQLDPRGTYPWTPVIPAEQQSIAQAVAENVADNRE